MLSGRGLCVGLIPHPEESYRLWCVCVSECDREASIMSRPWPTGGCSAMEGRKIIIIIIIIIPYIIISKSETTSEGGVRQGRNCSEKPMNTTG